ncbi:MAG: ribosome assembly RNA-binding protein YhbY [Geobacteraceae bacterium]
MLSGKQKRFLRGLGHDIKPVIMVGKNEVNEALTEETSAALAAHELVKVKILQSCLSDRHEVGDRLANACGAEVAQVLGRTVILYKQAETPKIELPEKKKAVKPKKRSSQ